MILDLKGELVWVSDGYHTMIEVGGEMPDLLLEKWLVAQGMLKDPQHMGDQIMPGRYRLTLERVD